MIERWPYQFRIDRYTVPGASDECWRWTAYHNPNGYPTLGVYTEDGKKASVTVARLIVWLADQSLPMFGHSWVPRHVCDVKWCVNPDHLISGSMRDNAQDMWSRGKGKPHHRLSEEQVREVRKLRAEGLTQQAIAERVGSNQSHVSAILRGAIWAWLE